MALCDYCGKELRWSETAHEACVLLYKQKALDAEQARVRRLQEEERERTRREAEERYGQEYVAWRSRHSALVNKFLEITERKVSVLDDYGDENWEALGKEIEVLFSKTAQVEKENIAPIKGLLFRDSLSGWLTRLNDRKRHPLGKGDLALWDRINSPLFRKYGSLKRQLEVEFRQYHEAREGQKSEPKLAEFSGAEFETYLAGLLRANGFEDVCGTPTTGDQGADLIAKRSGRTIAIQAKRYKGSVGNRAVQEVVGAVSFYGANEGWVVTTGTFTPSAKALAQKNGVKLVDGYALREKRFPGIGS